MGRTDGHGRGDPATASGENRWPPTGRFPWPPSQHAGARWGVRISRYARRTDRDLRKLAETRYSRCLVADTPAHCRIGCRFAAAFAGSKRQPPTAHSSSKHGRLDGPWADAVWRQKRIGHRDWTCVRRGPRSRCGLFLHVPIWHSRVVADPSSSRRSAAPASPDAQSRSQTSVSVGGADLNPFTTCAITGSG